MKHRTDESDKFPIGVSWSPYVEPPLGDFAGIVTITNQSSAISGSSQLWNSIITTTRFYKDPLVTLLDEWLDDDSGYDERMWPSIKEAIESNRLSSRKRFSD